MSLKQALFGELLFQFFKGSLQRPNSERFYLIGVNLILSASRVKVQPPLYEHFLAVLRHKSETDGTAPKNDNLDLAPVIFEREIDMPSTGSTVIRYLPLYPHILQVWLLFYQTFQQIRYFTDTTDSPCCHRYF
jgi:hypothetical protein